MKKDLTSNITVVNLMEPADMAGVSGASDLLDTAGVSGVELLVIVGALTGADSDNYLTPVLEESDTTEEDDFGAVDEAFILGGFSQVDFADAGAVLRAGYTGSKRYLRVSLNYTGSVTAGVVGVVGLLGFPGRAPAADRDAVNAT